jgi:uncharacterized RDD family membrane protein YckC
MLYDAFLVLGVLAFLFFAPHLILGMLWQVDVAGWLKWLHVFIALGIYFTWLWTRGQTLAMQTWRIIVLSADGSLPSRKQALLRYLWAWPSVLTGIGILWALLDRDRQFLHDRLAGTRIAFREQGG